MFSILIRSLLMTIIITATMLVPMEAFADTSWTTGAYSSNDNIYEQLSLPGADSLLVHITGTTELGADVAYIADENADNLLWFSSGNIDDTVFVNDSAIIAGLVADDSINESGVSFSLEDGTNTTLTTWTTGYYDSGVSMSEVLSIPAAYALEVTVTGQTEEGYDNVFIYDYQLNKVGTLTGNINETFTVHGSAITARLVSDDSDNASGVTVSIQVEGGATNYTTGCEWTGTWQLGIGINLNIEKTGNIYSGRYDWQNGLLSNVVVSGNTLIGIGTEYVDYRIADRYNLVFTMADNCSSFTGYYYYDDDPANRPGPTGFWDGTRVSGSSGSSAGAGNGTSGNAGTNTSGSGSGGSGSTGGTVSGKSYVSPDGLAAYYPFDGDVQDYSGNDYHGTGHGGAYVPGKEGQALKFDGKNNYVSTPFVPSKGNFTVEAWIKWDGTSDASRQYIIDNWQHSSRTRTIAPCLSTGLSNKISVFYHEADSGISGESIKPGEWYHVATTYDDGTVSLYVNGELQNSAKASPSGWNSAYFIGRAGDYNGRYFSGAIDEVRIFNRALGTGEIESIANGNPPGVMTGNDDAGGSNSGGTGSTSGSSSTIAQTSDPLLLAESRTVEPEDQVEVPIRMENISNVSSLNATISYDASVLSVVDIYKGSLLSNVMFIPNHSQSGVIKLGFAVGDASISSNGSIAYIEFEAIGGNGESSPVTISDISIKNKNGQSVSPQIQNGLVTIDSKTLTGDYNGDGRVTEIDALAALKMSVDMLSENIILDMDKDGEVTAEDAHLILIQAIGK